MLMINPSMSIEFEDLELGETVTHIFEEDAIEAVNTALAAGRPLLVRGEPGTGKSQLGQAVAAQMKRAFVSIVVDAHTEARDLKYRFDAVARLACAQLLGARRIEDGQAEPSDEDPLAEENFLSPGPLWWAFNWDSGTTQAGRARRAPPRQLEGSSPRNGVVLLIDEIDKADSSLPNGLLEALGRGVFDTPVGPVARQGQPLVIVTTNAERDVPDAFLRRCIVLQLALPTDRDELVQWLVDRGKAHFRDALGDVYEDAAALLVDDREHYQGRGLSAPGQAEYLDLLRALYRRRNFASPADLLLKIKKFVFNKHPDDPDDPRVRPK